MQVKYIVYNKQGKTTVDIWITNGSLTHPFYEKIHQIDKSQISSEGYVTFFPKENKWKLEHFPYKDKYQANTVTEFVRRLTIEKRDKILVYRALYRRKELEDIKLKIETYQEHQEIQKIKWKNRLNKLRRIFPSLIRQYH